MGIPLMVQLATPGYSVLGNLPLIGTGTKKSQKKMDSDELKENIEDLYFCPISTQGFQECSLLHEQGSILGIAGRVCNVT